MSEQGRQDSVVAEVQDLLLGTEDVVNFLDELARFAAGTLSRPGAEVFCGLTLLRRKTAGTVASSGEKAKSLDELQYQFNDGPCLTASRTGTVVHIRDLEQDRHCGPHPRPGAGQHLP